jgi:hypothetical protein
VAFSSLEIVAAAPPNTEEKSPYVSGSVVQVLAMPANFLVFAFGGFAA